jgi:hypothetical protein
MRHVLTVIFATLASPALAQDASQFGGFIEDVVTGQYAVDGSYDLRMAPLVEAITVGPLDVVLEETTMDTVRESFGGPLNEQGEAGGRVVWICLIIGEDLTLWFYSDGEMGGGKVNAVALEVAAPKPEWNCGSALEGIGVDFGPIPGLSAHPTEIDAVFLPLDPDPEGRRGYTNESPHPERVGFSVWQHVVYREGPDGIVDAIGVEQLTGD